MQINGTGHIHQAHLIRPATNVESKPAPHFDTRGMGGADELQISSQAGYVSMTKDIPDIRTDRVAEIRAQIASGAYETDEKIDIALERLLDEIG